MEHLYPSKMRYTWIGNQIMWLELKQVAIGVITSTFTIAILIYIFKESISTYIGKSIEHRANIKLEKFKAQMRAGEREIHNEIEAKNEELRSIKEYLSGLRRERESAIQTKRIESAEVALSALRAVGRMAIGIEMLKLVKIDYVESNLQNTKIQQFFESIDRVIKFKDNMEEFSKIKTENIRLYLSERSLALFDVYVIISQYAGSIISGAAVGLNVRKLYQEGFLKEKVTALYPTSIEGFSKFGDDYALYWATQIYKDAILSLRNDVEGKIVDLRDARAASDIAVYSANTFAEVQMKLKSMSIPEEIKKDATEQGML